MRYDVELPWASFKADVLDSGKYLWKWFEVIDHYYLFAKQNDFSVICKIHKDSGADQSDFEDNYKDNQSPELLYKTEGRFEREDIVLKIARMAGQADANGDIVLSILVPGEIGSEVRYTAGGYAFTDNYGWDDCVKKVEIADDDNILGFGAGTVVKVYHDSDADEVNQGWFFWKSLGSEGECEIEPMGWYGAIPSGLYLKITMELQANAKCKVDLWWGRVE